MRRTISNTRSNMRYRHASTRTHTSEVKRICEKALVLGMLIVGPSGFCLAGERIPASQKCQAFPLSQGCPHKAVKIIVPPEMDLAVLAGGEAKPSSQPRSEVPPVTERSQVGSAKASGDFSAVGKFNGEALKWIGKMGEADAKIAAQQLMRNAEGTQGVAILRSAKTFGKTFSLAGDGVILGTACVSGDHANCMDAGQDVLVDRILDAGVVGPIVRYAAGLRAATGQVGLATQCAYEAGKLIGAGINWCLKEYTGKTGPEYAEDAWIGLDNVQRCGFADCTSDAAIEADLQRKLRERWRQKFRRAVENNEAWALEEQRRQEEAAREEAARSVQQFSNPLELLLPLVEATTKVIQIKAPSQRQSQPPIRPQIQPSEQPRLPPANPWCDCATSAVGS
jgi:hypothetical protein